MKRNFNIQVHAEQQLYSYSLFKNFCCKKFFKNFEL